MTAVDAPPRASYRSVLAVREFRVLSAGTLMFALGFEFEILGLSVLVYARTGSATWTAAAFSAGFLPQAVGGAFLTSLADRMPPRAVITAGLLARAVPGLVIGLAPRLPATAMLALAAAAALVTPVFLAGSAGMAPQVLDGDAYVMGRSLLSVANSGIQIAGLGAGGALLAAVSARWLLLAAGGFLAFAAAVMRLGLRRRPARSGGGARGSVRATISGNAELLASARVRRLLLAQWLPCWFGTGAEALIVPFAESAGHPASAASALFACVPCGMLAGDLAVGRLCSPALRERLVLPLAALVGAPFLVFAFRPSLAVAGAALFVSGAGYAYPLGLQRAFLEAVPERLRGQGFGLMATGLMGGQGIAPSAVGAAAAVLGTGGAMAASGAAVMASALAAGHRRAGREETRGFVRRKGVGCYRRQGEPGA